MSRLLKFTADWCGPCKRVASSIQELASKYNVEVETVDIDNDEQNLSDKFKVTVVPTIVMIDANRQELDKITGTDLNEIESLFKRCSEDHQKKNEKSLKTLNLPISDDAVL